MSLVDPLSFMNVSIYALSSWQARDKPKPSGFFPSFSIQLTSSTCVTASSRDFHDPRIRLY